MAEVEKININDTDYDVADAKALRNKAEASTSFVDTRSGTTTYPTTGANVSNSIFIGEGANSQSNSTNHNVVIGNSAKLTNTNNGYGYNTVIGNYATSYQYYGTAIGYNSQVQGYGTSMGYNANSNVYSTALGCYTSAYYGGVALGYNAQVNNYSSYSIAIGMNSKVNSSCSNATAIGYNANVSASSATQLGYGTNSDYGTLKYREWQLLNNEGKIPVDRLPAEALGGGDTVVNLYQLPEDDSKHVVYQYTGTTNPLFTSNYFYRSEVQYSRPAISCSWVNSDFVKDKADVMIDQQKFFEQLIRETYIRKQNGYINQGCVGGDNSSMVIYLYYDVDNDQWDLEFNDDSIEGHTNPDMIEGIDLDTWGIYLNTAGVTLPAEEGAREEVFDLSYYAPIYFDSYDYNSDNFTIDYPQLMNGLCDGDWGVWTIESGDEWDFDVNVGDEANPNIKHYSFPDLPKKYYEDDGITFRFEWDTEHTDAWTQFINGEERYVYAWSTDNLASTFGIYVEDGEESNVEYIEFTLKPARQLYWEYCNPVDTSQFLTNDPSSFPDNYDQTKTQILEHNANGEFTWVDDIYTNWDNNIVEITTRTLDFNTLRTNGWYKFKGQVTNAPSSISASNTPILIRVINNNKTGSGEYCSQRIYSGQYSSHTIGSTPWGHLESCEWVRYYNGQWQSWQQVLTTTSGSAINGFDASVKQKLIHNGSTSTSYSLGEFRWVEDGLQVTAKTEAEYNALTTKDANTLYVITE